MVNWFHRAQEEASRTKINTKQAIQSAFRTLLLAKSLDKITVRDIVEVCGVTRNTFYYYYEDIYDLFDDYLDTQMQTVREALPADSRWDEGLMKLLGCVCETPQMGRHVFFSSKRDVMLAYLNKVLSIAIDNYISQELRTLTIASDDRRLVCNTCCHALYGLIVQWLAGPDAPLLQERLSRVLRVFEGSIRQSLRYCAENPE